MKYVTLTNLSQPKIAPIVAKYCQSFFCQLRGLMFTCNLPKDTGLLLVQGRDSRLEASIHMLFMWMDLAVIWINQDLQVVDTCLARRWRPAYFPKNPARYVLETTPDRLHDFKAGDKVRIDETRLD
jgi:uncharacterized membrane protein (UPF0127 family)